MVHQLDGVVVRAGHGGSPGLARDKGGDALAEVIRVISKRWRKRRAINLRCPMSTERPRQSLSCSGGCAWTAPGSTAPRPAGPQRRKPDDGHQQGKSGDHDAARDEAPYASHERMMSR